jgi:hypothetical protein
MKNKFNLFLLVIFFVTFYAERACAQISGEVVHATGPTFDNGEIYLDISDKQPPFDIVWSNGIANVSEITDLVPGDYIVTVSSTCCIEIETFTVISCPAIELNAVVQNSTGYSNCDGSIQLSPTGGASPYTFDWNIEGNTNVDNFVNLCPEEYCFGVTDVNGCVADDCANVGFQCPTNLVSVQLSQCICSNPNNGSIDITPNPNYAPYTFLWSGPNGYTSTNEDLLNISTEGTYTVTVTNVDGCTATLSETITNCASLYPFLYKVEVRPLIGNNQGPLIYVGEWDINGDCIEYNSQSFPFNGDITTTALRVKAYSNKPLSFLEVNMPDGSPSSATGTPSQGNIVWQFDFSPGVLANTVTAEHQLFFSGLDGDGKKLLDLRAMSNNLNECVEIADLQDDCSWSQAPHIGDDDVHVFQMGCMILNTFVPPPPQNNFVILQIQGSIPHYNVSWIGPNTSYNNTTSSTTVALPTNGAGTYTLKVRGANGCTVTKKVQFNTCPISFVVNVMQKVPSCPGQSNGTARVEAKLPPNSMATPIFNFSWPSGVANSNGNASGVTGIANGTHCVTVTESICGQSLEQCFDLNYISTLSASATLNTSNGCGTLPTGSIRLRVSGGKAPYSFIWNNGSTSNPLTGLLSGSYSVTITDACGTTTTGSYIIGVGSVISVVPQIFKECTNQNNGKINLLVSGDSPPFVYQWSNGETTSSVSNLTSGVYTVTITDECGKITVKSYTVGEYAPGTITMASFEPDCSQPGGQGELYISVNNPHGISQYVWSNGATTKNIVGLAKGNYSVTATDFNGCVLTNTFSLPQDNFDIDGPGTQVTQPGCSSNNGAINLAIVPSQYQPQIYNYIWSNGATTQDLTGIGAGIYTVTMTDAKGCVVNQTFELQSNAASPQIILDGLINPTMLPGQPPSSNGSIDISVVGGTSYTYLWSNGRTTQDISNLGPGTYTVTVTIITSGCTATKSFLLTPQSVVPGIQVNVNPFNGDITPCVNTANGYNVIGGAIDIHVSGGACSTYSYNWTGPSGFPGANTQDLSGLSIPGTYCVTVTDNCGSLAGQKCIVLECNCESNTNFDISNPCLLEPWHTFNPKCGRKWGEDGTADIELDAANPGIYDIKFSRLSPNPALLGTGRVDAPFDGDFDFRDWDLVFGISKVEVEDGDFLVEVTNQMGCYESYAYTFACADCNVIDDMIYLPTWYDDESLPPVLAIGVCAKSNTCGEASNSNGGNWPFWSDFDPEWKQYKFYSCATNNENICNAAGIIQCPQDCGKLPSDPIYWYPVPPNTGGQLISLGDDGCGCLFPPGSIPGFEYLPNPVFAEIDCDDPAPPNNEVLPCGPPTVPPPPEFTCPCESGCYTLYDEENCSYSVYCIGSEEPVEGQEDIPNYSLCRSNPNPHDISGQTVLTSFYLQCNADPCTVDYVGGFLITTGESPETYFSGENWINELWGNITLLSEVPNITMDNIGLDCTNDGVITPGMPDFCNLIEDVDVCICEDYQLQGGGEVEERGSISNTSSGSKEILEVLKTNNRKQFQTKVSPNPFSSSINLELNLTEGGEIKVEIIDYSGRLVEWNKLRIVKGRNQINYSMENILPDGLYFIKLSNVSGETNVHKVVKSSSH